MTSGVRALQAILDLRYPPLFLSHIPLGSLHRPSLTLFRVIPIAYVPFCIVFGHSLLYGLSSRFSLLDLRIYIQERAPFRSKQTYLPTGYKPTLALHCTAITLISAASGVRFLVIYPAALPGYTAAPTFVPGRVAETGAFPSHPQRIITYPPYPPIILYPIPYQKKLSIWSSPDSQSLACGPVLIFYHCES